MGNGWYRVHIHYLLPDSTCLTEFSLHDEDPPDKFTEPNEQRNPSKGSDGRDARGLQEKRGISRLGKVGI